MLWRERSDRVFDYLRERSDRVFRKTCDIGKLGAILGKTPLGSDFFNRFKREQINFNGDISIFNGEFTENRLI